jgi:hypothetical protein
MNQNKFKSLPKSRINMVYRITDFKNVSGNIDIELFNEGSLIGKFSCRKRCANCLFFVEYCTCSNLKEVISINPPGIKIDEAFRRKGIALTIYRLAEIYFGLRIMPDTPRPITEVNDGFSIKSIPGEFGTIEGKLLRKKYESLYGPWETDFYKVPSDKDLPIAEIIFSN